MSRVSTIYIKKIEYTIRENRTLHDIKFLVTKIYIRSKHKRWISWQGTKWMIIFLTHVQTICCCFQVVVMKHKGLCHDDDGSQNAAKEHCCPVRRHGGSCCVVMSVGSVGRRFCTTQVLYRSTYIQYVVLDLVAFLFLKTSHDPATSHRSLFFFLPLI